MLSSRRAKESFSFSHIVLFFVFFSCVGLSMAVKPLIKPPPSPKPSKPPPSPKLSKPPPSPKPSKPPPSPKLSKPPPPPKSSRPPPSPKPSKPPPSAKPPPSPPKPKKSPSPTPSPPFFNITSEGGARLVRAVWTDYGVAGRVELEVRVDPSSYSGLEDGGWAPVCNDFSMSEREAVMICNAIGFDYGRQYYREGISTFGPDETEPPTSLGWLSCGEPGLSDRGPAGYVVLSDYGPICLLYTLPCDRKVLDAVECANQPLPPISSSPPPRPPSPPPQPAPPPPPPRTSPYIRKTIAEPNIRSWEANRFTLLVNPSADGRTGSPVWAPLCATADDVAAWQKDPEVDLDDYLANIACHQTNDWYSGWSYYLYTRQVPPLLIPSGKPATETDPETGESLFDPTAYTHWITVVGPSNNSNPRMVQDFQLQVTTSPCPTGYLYSALCVELTP